MIIRAQIAILVVLFGFGWVQTDAAPRRLSARIGVKIMSGADAARAATPINRIQKGDRVAVYLEPRQAGFFYIIESHGKRARLLQRGPAPKARKVRAPERPHALGGGESRLHVILAPGRLAAVEGLFARGDVPTERWRTLALELERAGRMGLTDTSPRPIPVAAGVRGMGDEQTRDLAADPFFRKLRTYSGRGLIVREYRFHLD